jgi:predicted alpha/beta-hydrolase family hydrolase
VGNLTLYPSESPAAALLLAHGAGAGPQSPFMVSTARAIAARGIIAGTFDFPYMAARRKVPDPAAVLEEAWRAAVASARGMEAFRDLPLFVGGKSMGGRIASQAEAAEALHVAGLIFLGYPLHPPGKPQQRRDAHLPSITAPMLFVQGSRDAFGTAEEIRDLLPRLPRAELHVVEGGDHSFKVPKTGGTSQARVNEEINDRIVAFIRASIQN